MHIRGCAVEPSPISLFSSTLWKSLPALVKHSYFKHNPSEAFLTLPGQSPSVHDLERTTEEPGAEPNTSGRLVQEESKGEGAVALHVYGAYWRAMGSGLASAILISLLLMQGETHPGSS